MLSFKYVAGFLVLMSVAGCGFQPLYQSNLSQNNDELHSIKILTISDREGQILRNYLLDSLNPYGEPQNPRYRLIIDLVINDTNLSFRRDSTAARTIITSQANFKLIDIASGRVILSNAVDATTAHNIGLSVEAGAFPTIVAEKAERERAMKLLAHEIRLQIASFLVFQEKS